MDTLELDVNQLGGVVEKDWGMNLQIMEKFDSKGAPFYVAALYLYKPNGTEAHFPERRVKYSATSGYSITFSKGGLADSDGDPILDTRGRPTVDKNSQIKFTKLLFKKLFDSNNNNAPYWMPAAGGVNFKFLGQGGFTQVFNFDISLFSISAANSK